MRRSVLQYILIAGLFLLPACTMRQHSERADKAAYTVISEKQEISPEEGAEFSIEYRPIDLNWQSVWRDSADGAEDSGGIEAERRLGLDETLAIAFYNSRAFQDRKESLYGAALRLANARHRWSLFGGGVDASASRREVAKTSRTRSGEADTGVSFAQQFAQGGSLALGLGLNLASDLLSMGSNTAHSLISANLTQPLVRGAWNGLAYESLYRQERDLAIAVLEYERFTQTFSVGIATRYYQVLQQLDELENERENISRLEQTLRTTRALVEGGQVSPIQQDQAEQDLLDAKVRLTLNSQRYQDSLDNFKLLVGLPISSGVALEPAELRRLTEQGPAVLPLAEEEAIEAAYHTRPDVLTQLATVRDAKRNVDIAVDNFKPGVNLAMGVGTQGTEPRSPMRFQWDKHSRDLGLDLDYSFDQTNNRDAYRLALMAQAKAERDYAEFLDRVELDVRQAYRQLSQARQSYELQRRSVDVARRRRKLASEQQRAGEASARDVLEAEDALRRSLNGLTSAVVTYETTRLGFLATLGMLSVDQDGQIEVREVPRRFDKYQERYGGASAAAQ